MQISVLKTISSFECLLRAPSGKIGFFPSTQFIMFFFSYVTSTIHQILKTKNWTEWKRRINIHETVTSKWNGIHCLFFRPTECRRQCGISCFNLIRLSYSLNIWFYCHTIWLNWGCFDGCVGFFASLSISLAFNLNILRWIHTNLQLRNNLSHILK